MKERLIALCPYATVVAFFLIWLITCICVQCFDRGFYEREYQKMDTAASLHMSHADLMKATETLLDYLEDQRDDIKVSIEVFELPKEAFNERESKHMVDVKHLYQFALSLRLAAIVIGIVSLAALWMKKRNVIWEQLSVAYTRCCVTLFVFLAFLGMWAAVDFTGLWESFHHVFFRNDLWLLNPRTDLMINLFPEEFFLHMVMRIALMFAIGFVSLLGVSVWYLKKHHLLWIMSKSKRSQSA